jgi:predicted ATP-grasp superfamily ATP-dependent carboligase
MTLPSVKKPLVIAGASCRSAAQRATLAGFECLAFDQFCDRDLGSIAQVHQLDKLYDLEDAFWEPWSRAPVLFCGGIENRLEAIDWLMKQGLACGVSSMSLAKLRDIHSWARWSHAAGIGWPETISCSVRCNDSQDELLRKDGWLKKSKVSAGGLGVRPWAGEFIESSEYLQQSMQGEVLGVTFLSSAMKAMVVGCMQSWPENAFPGSLPFIYRGSVGPIRLAMEERDRLKEFATCVQHETGYFGCWQADFVRNDEGWWLLEINPRWSSSMELLEVAYDISLVEQHVCAQSRASESHNASAAWDRFETVCMAEVMGVIGKVVRYAVEDLKPTPTMLDRWWEYRWDGASASLRRENRLADIPGDTNIIPMGYPICTEFALGVSMEEVQLRLHKSLLVAESDPHLMSRRNETSGA